MKKIIIKILAFLALVLVLGIALDYAITNGFHKYTSYSTEVWNDIRNPDVTPDFAIMGSCAAHYDCNPAILDSVLNCNSYVLSMSNLTFPSHNFIWTIYKKYKTRLPKTIIVLLDYGDLGFRDVKTSMEDEQFLPLTDTKEGRDFLVKYGGYAWYEIYLPCVRYFGHQKLIKHGLKSFLFPFHSFGAKQHYKGFIPLDKPYAFHGEWFGKENFVKIEPEVVKMFEDFMDDCASRDIEVILAIAPLGYELESIISNKDEIYSTFETLAERHNCRFASFTDNEFCRDTSNFESPNHLNARTADIFTAELAEFVKGEKSKKLF